MRLIALASLLAMAGGAAIAQTPSKPVEAPGPAAPAAATSSAVTPPAADASASTGFRAGMAVKDGQGAAIGSIARVIRTPDGATTFSVTVDGRNVNLPGSTLTLSPSGAEAISSLSKAQITATTSPPV